MAGDTNIPIAFLRQALDPDDEAGTLTWRTRPREHFATERAWAVWNAAWAGKVAGSPSEGYSHVQLTFAGRRRTLNASRIIYALTHGHWPPPGYEVDHKDGVEAGDGIGNLREATRSEQMQNIGQLRNNTSGFPNVSWHKQRGKWQAYIKVAWRRIYLGLFDDLDEAFFAVCDAKVVYHPFSPSIAG